jgi:SPP1 family phage portal protein
MDYRTYLTISRAANENASRIISDLIKEHRTQHDRMISLYLRYRGDVNGVPIFSRTLPSDTKINAQINNDFFGEIIDTKTGYVLGNPIDYETGIENGVDPVKEFNKLNRIDDLDAETMKMMSVCGQCGRLLYVDTNGKARAMRVPPWECIWIQDMSLDEVQLALRYYPIQVIEGDTIHERTRVEWYERNQVTYYLESSTGMYELDYTFVGVDDKGNVRNPDTHVFGGIPLIQFKNNEELLADGEKALKLIDAYDRAVSDASSEIEQFRFAYLLLYGVELTDTELDKLRQSGALAIPDDGRAEFLTKNVVTDMLEKFLDRTEANILRFSKSVNFGDQEFTSDISGESRKWKLLTLENKAIIAERKFTAALMKQFQLLNNYWSVVNTSIDLNALSFQFTRNIPNSLNEEADLLIKLLGNVPTELAYSLVSFIKDAKKTKEELEEERSAYRIPLENEEEKEDEEAE